MIPKKGNGIAMLQDRIAELEAEVERLKIEETDWIKHKQYLDEVINELYDKNDQLRSALEEIIRFYTENFADGYGMAAVNIAKQALKGE